MSISAGQRGQILEMDSSDWSNGIRYHILDTSPDTEFKPAQSSSYTRLAVALSRDSIWTDHV